MLDVHVSDCARQSLSGSIILVGKVIDMLSTCCTVGEILEHFETNLAVYNTGYYWRFFLCRVHQMMTQKKMAFFIIYCIFEFFVTRGLHSTKKKEKTCLEVQFLLQSPALFEFLNMSDIGVGVVKF